MTIVKILSQLSRTNELLEHQRQILLKTSSLLEQAHKLQKSNSLPDHRIAKRIENSNLEAIKNQVPFPEETTGDHTKHLEEFYKGIYIAQEAERARIARELHDEFGQAIIAIRTEIELISSEYN